MRRLLHPLRKRGKQRAATPHSRAGPTLRVIEVQGAINLDLQHVHAAFRIAMPPRDLAARIRKVACAWQSNRA